MRFVILLSLFLSPYIVFCEDAKMPVVIDGDEISYLQQEGKVVAKGNVRIESKDSILFCQEAVYDANSNIAHIKGDVRITKGNSILYGQDVIYDFNTHNAEMVDIRLKDPPVYGEAEDGDKVRQEKYVLKKAYITTCDLEIPHYRLTAKTVTVYPEDRIIAKNVLFKVGKTPIFYLPYFSQSLKDNAFAVRMYPGKTAEWGAFLLTRWRYNLNDENEGIIHFDKYEDRGNGIGVTHTINSKDFGKTLINYYAIFDNLYKLDGRKKLVDMYGNRSGEDDVTSKRLEDDRYRVQLAHQWEPAPNLSITSEFNKFSDQYFIKDFFENEYEISPDTKTYNLIRYGLGGSSISLFTQARVNRFYGETEYLPQLEYDFSKQNLGGSKFYLESNDKAGLLQIRVADTQEGYSKAFRFHSHNVLNYVNKIKWLNINPYIGSYSTFYSRNKFYQYNVWRQVLETGATANVKVYKYFNAGWGVFGEEIDMMRHILKPEVTYGYMHDPTVSSSNLIQFDGDDSFSRSESVTFALENKLQARNKERTWDFIYFSPSASLTINEKGRGCYWNSIDGSLEIYPKEGLSLTAHNSYDIATRRVSSFDIDFTFKGKTKVIEEGEEVEKEKYSFSYGQRYSRQSSTQGTLDFSYQLTPKLKFRSYLRCEYNTDDIQAQQYSIRADLHCWWLDLGLDVNKHERGGKDLGFWFIFTLKEFPDISAGFDHTYEGAKPNYSEP